MGSVVTITLDCSLWKMGFRVGGCLATHSSLLGSEETEEYFQEISIKPGIWYPAMASWSSPEEKTLAEIELIE